MSSPRIILVPIDFSEDSAVAIAAAREQMRPGDKVHLVHILASLAAMHPGVVWDTTSDADRVGHVRTAMSEFAAAHGLHDPEMHALISTGNPAHAVSELAGRLSADLVVVASHGRTGFARLALGSVAEGIARLCSAPVLIVKSKESK